MNIKQLFQTKKARYGSVAVAFTVIFIAAVIVFNIVFGTLVNKYRLSVDMTANNLYEVTDSTRELLRDTKMPVSIIFMSPEEDLKKNVYSNWILNFAKELEREFDFITIRFVDTIANPGETSKYKTTAAENVLTTDVVVETDIGFLKYAQNTFFMYDDESGDMLGFNAELKFISAILQLTASETQVVYYTTGHGESKPQALLSLFDNAGFVTKEINLTKEDIGDDARILIIYDPIYDFVGTADDADARSEIDKIDDFLDRFGNLMVFVNPETPQLPKLYEFLEEWGISYRVNTTVKDVASSTTTDGFTISASYPTEGLGASLHKHIRENISSQPMTIVKEAMPIDILWTERWFSVGDAQRDASAVLTSTVSAEAISKNVSLGTDRYNLVTLSRESRYDHNTLRYSYVFASGSTMFADETYLNSNAYANNDIIYNMMLTMGVEKVPVEIPYKKFDSSTLDITTSTATVYTVVLAVVLPLAVLVTGLVVCTRRKHL